MDTPSEAFEPSHFEAAICRTWRYQKSDEMKTWKSIYHSHSTVTLLSPQPPQTPPWVTKSVKTLIQSLSALPLLDNPISFQGELRETLKGEEYYHRSIDFIPLIKLKIGSVPCWGALLLQEIEVSTRFLLTPH